MARNQAWVHFAPEMVTEWMQCMEEGLDVESYRALCEDIAGRGTDWDDIAWEVAKKMHAAPRRADYPYEEPSDYAGILAARPEKRHPMEPVCPCKMEDKVRGAWTGRIAGCLLGKPVEGMRRPQLYKILGATDNYPMHKYITRAEFSEELVKEANIWLGGTWADNIGGIEPEDDDTNYTVFGMKMIQCYGKNFSSDDVMDGWMRFIPYLNLCTAERVAYRNGAAGLYAPDSATYRNPYREWIGAQIRGDFFGYINPGNPEAAASMAYRDAAISHIKNGIYGEMFCTAMVAAAAATDDIMTIIEAGLDEIPAKCRLREDVERVLAWHRDGLGREAIIDKIHETYNENTSHGWCHTNSNAMIVTMALLVGEGDFGKSVCAAVQAAFDTDCNGATVGSIIGMRNGIAGIPEYWSAPFGGRLLTSIQDNNNVSVEDLAAETIRIMKSEK
ncbi:MAG: ADP-ribosylglycohydrolase family protein [Clostridia bacterium]|nr:ADP-ribosylglycohydrolase family protein [Clostridia bacterium]